MTTLILLRHGEAGTGRTDLERPLTATGIAQAAAVGEWLRDADLLPDRCLVSPARRTVETFRGLNVGAPMTVVDELYESTGDRVLDEINALPADVPVLLVVAHFPALPEAATLLDPDAAGVMFSPATALVLDLDAGPATPGSGRMTDRFTP